MTNLISTRIQAFSTSSGDTSKLWSASFPASLEGQDDRGSFTARGRQVLNIAGRWMKTNLLGSAYPPPVRLTGEFKGDEGRTIFMFVDLQSTNRKQITSGLSVPLADLIRFRKAAMSELYYFSILCPKFLLLGC